MLAPALQIVALIVAAGTLLACTLGMARLACSVGARRSGSEVRTQSDCSSSCSSSDSSSDPAHNPTDTMQLFIAEEGRV
jgi:hypothetical protein